MGQRSQRYLIKWEDNLETYHDSIESVREEINLHRLDSEPGNELSHLVYQLVDVGDNKCDTQ